jgi:hypothetical protein
LCTGCFCGEKVILYDVEDSDGEFKSALSMLCSLRSVRGWEDLLVRKPDERGRCGSTRQPQVAGVSCDKR